MLPKRETSYFILSGLIFLLLIFILSNLIGNITKPFLYSLDKTSAVYQQSAYLVTDQDNLSPTSLLQTKNAFTRAPLSDIPWRLKPQQYWIKLTLFNRNLDAAPLVVRFDNPMIDNLDIYRFDADSRLAEMQQLGDLRQNLSLLEYSIPHHAFTLEGNGRATLLIHIKTTGISKTPITFYGADEFTVLSKSIFAIWGMYVGVLLMVAVYNLILYFSIHDRVYLVYVGYILSVLILIGTVLGFGFYIWPLGLQLFFHKYVVVSNYGIAIFTLAFCILFLRYHRHKTRHYRVGVIYLWVLVIMGLVSFALPEYMAAPLFFVAMAGLYIICFWLIYNKLVSGFRWAKFYVLSWFPLVFSAAVQPLELTGVLDYSFVTRHAFLAGTLVEIAMMALALADRVRYQRERALYHATHNSHSGLLNYSALGRSIKLLDKYHRRFTLCLLQMDQYQTLLPLLNVHQTNRLIRNIAEALEQQLMADRQFYHFESSVDHQHKVVELNGGILAFVTTKHQGKNELQSRLTQLLKGLPESYRLDGLDLQFSYRIVVTHGREYGNQSVRLLEKSAELLDYARQTRQNLVFDHMLPETATQDLALAARLQSALEENKLTLYHQPQLDINTQRVVGTEVLLRWPDATANGIYIEQIIQLAERVGLINRLTLWVIEQAARDLHQLNAQGFNLPVSVNLSAHDLQIKGFIEIIKETLQRHNLEASQFKFELTEHALVDEPAALRNLIQTLTGLGSTVVLDDYGTGYCSLSYLVEYAFSEIKIDKRFVMELAQSRQHQTIVETTIDMAHNLGMSVTAEGVETKESLAMLKQFGADKGQGYLFAKPMPFEQLLTWLMRDELQLNRHRVI